MLEQHILMNVAVTIADTLLKARTSMVTMFVSSGKQCYKINYTVWNSMTLIIPASAVCN
jgi:hypothetical protein